MISGTLSEIYIYTYINGCIEFASSEQDTAADLNRVGKRSTLEPITAALPILLESRDSSTQEDLSRFISHTINLRKWFHVELPRQQCYSGLHSLLNVRNPGMKAEDRDAAVLWDGDMVKTGRGGHEGEPDKCSGEAGHPRQEL
ncbi:hypothetical protein chiPu_0006064 [Chiloscyllium punctatum]|uniref:Uncharacterized protein n=1 Tax=Chiloscyllium punctatum TaxID=137246 RepID=A0A401SB57_CHIPU|nr:hypothetical protein [Chiloscyllium punctatum]